MRVRWRKLAGLAYRPRLIPVTLRPGPDQKPNRAGLGINPRFLPECAETAGRDDKDPGRSRHARDPWHSALRDRTAGSGAEARLGRHAHPETSSSSTTPAPPPRYCLRASRPTEAACLPPMAAQPSDDPNSRIGSNFDKEDGH